MYISEKNSAATLSDIDLHHLYSIIIKVLKLVIAFLHTGLIAITALLPPLPLRRLALCNTPTSLKPHPRPWICHLPFLSPPFPLNCGVNPTTPTSSRY